MTFWSCNFPILYIVYERDTGCPFSVITQIMGFQEGHILRFIYAIHLKLIVDIHTYKLCKIDI